jgi:hypothetical protein
MLTRQSVTQGMTMLVLLGALAACGGSSSSSTASVTSPSAATDYGGTVADACSLLTAAQAATAISVPKVDAKAEDTNPPACTYAAPASAGAPVDKSSVTIIVVDQVTFEGTASRVGMSVNGITFTKQDGIGDEAYLTSGGTPPLSAVMFRKGKTYIQVAVHKEGLTAAQLGDAEMTLAKQIVSKLK